MKKKFLTGFFIFLGLVGIIAMREISLYAFDFCFLAVSSMAAFEVAKCLDRKGQKNYFYASLIFPFFVYVAFLIPYLLKMSWWWILIFEVWVLFISFVVLAIIALCKKQKFSRVWWTLFSFVYPSYLLMFFYFVNHSGNLFALNVDLGLFGILLVLAISTITDSFAMYTGMILKGPKIWKKASPNKTISGCLGGLVFGILASMGLYWIFSSIEVYGTLFANFNIKLWQFIIVGFVGSLLNQLGDLMESFFKRKVGVKDTGNFFPGHGGFMDRVDGWCFNVVGIYFALLILFF